MRGTSGPASENMTRSDGAMLGTSVATGPLQGSKQYGGRRLLCLKAEVAMRVEGVGNPRTTRYIRCGR